ncbi:MAG: ATP-dependent helicase RecQ [Schlesneria sp.]|nr:ATP-dependent helicase RecQ [Schlesneria sp.]
MTATAEPTTPLRDALLRYWGYDSFRPLQAEAMQAVVEHRDSLVVMPTGGGKSICFQAPAVTMPGIAIVVSPLISLMKDQVDTLRECGISAACVNSAQTAAERQQIAADVRSGNLKLLYVAPERLCTQKMLDFLADVEVSLIAIDEAHCISAWGHDFRPEYRMLRQLRSRFPKVGVHAYTATATEEVRRDIVAQLGLESAELLVGSFDRPNLVYKVVRRKEVLKQVREVIDANPNESGIVYCISRREVDELAEALRRAGYKAKPYHAGLSDQERHKHQDEFLNDDIQIVVATVAFGMGIDKSNVRYVIHTGSPKSLEHYQQETGRAGRDGLEASCWLIWTAGNFITWRKMLSDLPADAFKQADDSLKSMERFCNGVTCRHKVLVEHFGQQFGKDNCEACDVCLEQIEQVAEPLVLGQKILSCVVRVKESFGADYVAQVLTGSREARIVENGHDQLSTWGLLKNEKKTNVRDWIEQLASQGYMTRVGDYNVLKVTPTGWELLHGKSIPRLLQAAAKKTASRAAKSEADSWEGVDSGLFEALRQLRRQIATEHNVPPFVVFADTTLRDLARRRPTTLAGFRQAHGVGDKKTAEYGETFLQAIAQHAAARGLTTDIASTSKKPQSEATAEAVSTSAAQQAAFDLFREGKSIEEVRLAVNRASATVCEYLVEFIHQTELSDPSTWVDEATSRKIIDARRQQSDNRLRPIFEAVGGTVTYDTIRITLACLQHEAPPLAPD